MQHFRHHGQQHNKDKPSPLDPEYWRGITHSCEERATTSFNASQQPYYEAYSPLASAQVHPQHQVVISPIPQARHVSKGFDMQDRSSSYSYAPPTYQDNQLLKTQLRRSFSAVTMDLKQLFSAYDHQRNGGISSAAFQDALNQCGIFLSPMQLKSIQQMFFNMNVEGIDYTALSTFIAMDSNEIDSILRDIAHHVISSYTNVRQMLQQYDPQGSGCVPRSSFFEICRRLSNLSDVDLHWFAQAFVSPFEPHMISYGRLMEVLPPSTMNHVPTYDIRASHTGNGFPVSPMLTRPQSAHPHIVPHPPTTMYPPNQYTGYSTMVNHAVPTAQVVLQKNGWICRVCAHQQVEDWVTHCEICETSKPRGGARGIFIKCPHCKFDNNFDAVRCELCNHSIKSRKSKKKYASSSSSSSSSCSSSSSSSNSNERHHRRSRRSKSKRARKQEFSPRFHRGETIQAIPLNSDVYEIGRIVKIHKDDTYDVKFDNGMVEQFVPESSIREVVHSKHTSRHHYSQSPRKNTSRHGHHREDHRDERQSSHLTKSPRHDKSYQDESSLDFQPKPKSPKKPSRPEPVMTTDSESSSRPPKYKVGQGVKADYKRQGEKIPAVVAKVHSDGTYDLEYETGKLESHVSESLISTGVSSSPKKKKVEDTTTSASDEKIVFEKGQKIEAKYGGKSSWKSGVIVRKRVNGTYDIDYDEGEKETGVAARLIRSKASSPKKKKVEESTTEEEKPKKFKFKQGDKVEAQYRGRDKFYPGIIARVRLNGSYDIDYDKGEKETGVSVDLIRARGSNDSESPKKKKVEETTTEEENSKKTKFQQGDKVEAKCSGEDKYYPGVITRVRLNGTYIIEYDHGMTETGVAAALIRPRGSSPKKKKIEESSEDDRAIKFKEGDKVEAQYKGKSKFYLGVISRCRLNGTYDIEYDDGEKETGVKEELIKLRTKKDPSPPKKKKVEETTTEEEKPKKTKFQQGDKIEAKCKGEDKFCPGVITRVRLNGTYIIEYDHGMTETGVAADLIRLRGSSPKKKNSDETSDDDKGKKKKFKEGEKVEAQYKGKSKFYPGVISRCRLNGTYDIDYDDGEKETGVAADLIRSKEKSSPKKKSSDDTTEDEKKSRKFKEGEKVEAQYKGKSKFYPGVITRVRSNGTYDIDYDDGEMEKEVLAKYVRSKLSSSPKKKANLSDDESTKKYREGDKVEAQYKGKEKFYPGVISRCRLNGTYDIDYDDGEKEKEVNAKYIKLKNPSSRKKESDGDKKSAKFTEGEKVEAQYKGKSKFYPGVISRCRLNGTYDIDYYDGEKETGVAADLIRSKELSSPTKKSNDESTDDENKRFSEGDKVEAQYKGKSKFYPGEITRVRSNGTYDIDYDDGEKEKEVLAKYVRSKQSSSPKKKSSGSDTEVKKKFKEGEKIEAQYKGKSKFYPGVISRCRMNGTYDIDYDDGENETGVAANLIRSRESTTSKKPSEPSSDSYRVGAKVEALYKGKTEWYKGTISKDHGDGRYDIQYDDGDKEMKVPAKLIRPTKSISGRANFQKLVGSTKKSKSGNSSD